MALTNDQIGGLVGGILGSVLGILGGVFGTWATIKNARGPRERAFVIRASIVVWIVTSTYLVAFRWLPPGGRVLSMTLWPVVLLPGIRSFNRRQQQLREGEAIPGR